MSRKKKKKSGALGVFITFLVIAILVVLLFATGIAGQIRINVERMVYPLNYREEILLASEKYDIEPQIIAAVIYSESKFDTKATSSANAKGLMQMMDSTFEELVRRRGESFVPEDLYTPEVSIDYGVYYLKTLCDKFGDIYTACAAYNAGPYTVSLWLDNEEYSKDGKTLIKIPYSETEKYVDKISKATIKYKELYFTSGS